MTLKTLICICILAFCLQSCKKNIATHTIYGPSGQAYEIQVYDNHSIDFRPMNQEEENWMDGQWSGGLAEKDTFKIFINMQGLTVKRSFLVEKDSLKSLNSEIVK